MNICELCGNANSELDTECRVCGHALSALAEQQPASVATQHASAHQSTPASHPDEQAIHPVADVPRSLQVSSVREQAPTGAPPMLSNESRQESTEPEQSPHSSLPGFMQEGGRAHPASQESVELISASDLPGWIRQIAEADSAKAEAEAEIAQSAPAGEAPASIIKRALPGETRASGPPTSWLSKSAAQQESSEHWASEEAAAANWGATEASAPQTSQPSYPTVSTGTAYVPTFHEQTVEKSRSRFGRSQSSSSAGGPIYQNRTVQIAALILLLVVLAALLV